MECVFFTSLFSKIAKTLLPKGWSSSCALTKATATITAANSKNFAISKFLLAKCTKCINWEEKLIETKIITFSLIKLSKLWSPKRLNVATTSQSAFYGNKNNRYFISSFVRMGNKKSIPESSQEFVLLPSSDHKSPPRKRNVEQQVQLPNDILKHILSFLSPTENVTSIALSCRQLFQLLRTDNFLKHSFFPWGG